MGKDLNQNLQARMPGQMLMQVGRVVYINYGPCKGKTAVVIDIVDENRIMVNGPTTGVPRQVIPTKRLALTRFLISTVLRNQHEAKLTENITAYDLEKKRNAQAVRARNSDFDRFRALVLRRKVAE